MKRILHVGCGSKANKLPSLYIGYQEVRLDSNPMVDPDVVASIVAMPMVDSEGYDFVLASHVVEHLYAHEVAMALGEFYRVLKPGGIVDVRVPDLQSIGGKLALDEASNAIYNTAAFGLIAPLDMIYGHRGSVGAGNFFMAHKTGFTSSVMKYALTMAGFESVECDTLSTQYELRAMAQKPVKITEKSIFDPGGPAEDMVNLATNHV